MSKQPKNTSDEKPPVTNNPVPLTAETLQRFREALEIVLTGKDKDGNQYNNMGTLNQAAWIGEHSGILIREIERLRPELKNESNN